MSVIINPGAGPVEGATIEHARENIKQLICDIDETGITVYEHEYNRLHDDGRFSFSLSRIGYHNVDIDMPGLPLEQVRYMNQEKQNIWHFPRLYINGSSFVWKFVVELARHDLTMEPEIHEA